MKRLWRNAILYVVVSLSEYYPVPVSVHPSLESASQYRDDCGHDHEVREYVLGEDLLSGKVVVEAQWE